VDKVKELVFAAVGVPVHAGGVPNAAQKELQRIYKWNSQKSSSLTLSRH
jgi:hypothetical protein